MPRQVSDAPNSRRNIRKLMGGKSQIKAENSKLDNSDQVKPDKDEDWLLVCLICKDKIKINSVERQLSDLKFHYTKCYWEEGKFSYLFTAEDLKKDEEVRDFSCPHDECTKRKRNRKTFSSHMGIAHKHTADIMSKDNRAGFMLLFNKLYPEDKYLAFEKVKKVEKRSLNSEKTEEHSEPAAKKKRTDKISRKNEERAVEDGEPQRSEAAVQSVVKVEPILPVLPELESEEEVDDPSSLTSEDPVETKPNPYNLNPPLSVAVQPPAVRTKLKEEEKETFVPPRVDKMHNCLLCGGYGKNNKDGRNMNLGTGLKDLMYHYAICFYERHKFQGFIDSGSANRDDSGKPIEEVGGRFKYKCPFDNCSKNTGRGGRKLMGFKEYAIHCSVVHHILEEVLEKDSTPGMEEVRAALVLNRRKEDIPFIPMPAVQVEEVHVCLLCRGDNRDGKILSFDKAKIRSLKYHYASCYYDTGVYKKKYPPGQENEDENGDPLDYLGKTIKYQCKARGCTSTAKRMMGYKEFCIHSSNDHGGLLDIMKDEERPQLREIGRRLAQFFS